MRLTTAINDNVFDFQALLHPGTVFEHPKDVGATFKKLSCVFDPAPLITTPSFRNSGRTATIRLTSARSASSDVNSWD